MNKRPGTATELPWHDSETWEKGFWYPMPVGYFAHDPEDWDGYIINGYGVFELDEHGLKGDVKPALDHPHDPGDLTFAAAILICELHNGRKFFRRDV